MFSFCQKKLIFNKKDQCMYVWIFLLTSESKMRTPTKVESFDQTSRAYKRSTLPGYKAK